MRLLLFLRDKFVVRRQLKTFRKNRNCSLARESIHLAAVSHTADGCVNNIKFASHLTGSRPLSSAGETDTWKKKTKKTRTHENITFCNKNLTWCHSGFGPPIQIRYRIWTPLRRFGPPYQTFLLNFVSYLVTNSICKLFCRCSFQSQQNISSIKVKKRNCYFVPILPHSL